MDIYAAGEKKPEDLSKEVLINSLIAAGHKDPRKYDSIELKNLIKNKLYEGDILVFLGAGDITTKARVFVKEYLEEK